MFQAENSSPYKMLNGQPVILAAVDSGRKFVKVLVDLPGCEPFEFESKIAGGRELHSERKISADRHEFEVYYDGKHYFVSELAVEGFVQIHNHQNTKATEQNLVVTLTALAHAGLGIRDKDLPIVLVTTVPVENYDLKTSDDRTKIKEMFEKEHR